MQTRAVQTPRIAVCGGDVMTLEEASSHPALFTSKHSTPPPTAHRHVLLPPPRRQARRKEVRRQVQARVEAGARGAQV